MDKNEVLTMAQQFAVAVKSAMPAVKFYLFGSYAKGNIHANSDIAVVLTDFDNYIEMQLALMRIRRKIDSRIEPHLFKEIDFVLPNALVNEIISNGNEIFA